MQMIKVFGLMTGLTLLLVFAGSYFGGTNGAVLFFVIAAVMNFGMYWFSDKAVLKMYKARIIGPDDAPELYEMVDRLRQRAGLPMPVVAIAPQQQPNAFATGRSPSHAVVCVTAGILQSLNRRELEGVIAHELAHIDHRHMLVGTIAATMAGAIAMLGSIVRWGMIFGGFGGRDDGDQNPIALLAMALAHCGRHRADGDQPAERVPGRRERRPHHRRSRWAGQRPPLAREHVQAGADGREPGRRPAGDREPARGRARAGIPRTLPDTPADRGAYRAPSSGSERRGRPTRRGWGAHGLSRTRRLG